VGFQVWATLLTEESCNRLVGKLVDTHCTVKPLSENGTRGVMGETACLLAIEVSAGFKNVNRSKHKNKMLDFIKSSCDEIDAHYFSIVVHDPHHGTTWCGEGPQGRQQ